MIKIILAFPIIVVLTISLGCMSPPERRDPYAALKVPDIANPVYKELTVAIIMSDNTKEAMKYIKRFNLVALQPDLYGNNIIRDFESIIRRNFKSAVKVKNMEDARSAKTDLIAILDSYFTFPSSVFGEAKAEFSIILLSAEGKHIDVVKGDSVKNPLDWPGFIGAPKITAASQDAIEEALKVAENALLSSVKFSEFAKLKAGASSKIAATTKLIAPEKLSITSDIDTLPAFRVNPRHNAYAMVIGIENYRDKLPAVDFATSDAKLMTEYLTKIMGYPEENVITLLNDRATKSDIKKYAETWLSNNVEEGGSVLVYYSGHGAPDPTTGDAFIVPYDGDPTFIDDTGYPLDRLYKVLDKLPARQIVVMLDSCFSGAGGRSVIAKGARPMVVKMKEGALASDKLAVLSASSGNQISSTYDEKGHGLFTYFMLKGLKGEGDTNGDGKVEIGELYSYIKPNVIRVARKKYNNEQTPQMIAPKGKKLYLSGE